MPFEREALERADLVAIGRRRIAVASAEDLIVYKAIAARERDLSDIQLHGDDIDLPRARRTVSELATVLEQPELVHALDRLPNARRQGFPAAPGPRARKTPSRRSR